MSILFLEVNQFVPFHMSILFPRMISYTMLWHYHKYCLPTTFPRTLHYKRILHLPSSLSLPYELLFDDTSDFGTNSLINTFNNGISRSDLEENCKGPSHTHTNNM